MNNKIKNVLDNIGIENFYITKEDFKGECVVYNYTSKGIRYADNEEKGREYSILLNIYNKENVEEIKEKIRKAMLKNKFNGGIAQKTLKEKNGLFNTPMMFKGRL